MTECNGPKRLRISWSQVRVHEECRQKAMLQRKQKRSPATDIRNFFHGTLCDRIMRARLEGTVEGSMVDQVEPYIERLIAESRDDGEGVVRWKSANDRVQMTQMCKDALANLEPMLEKWVLPYDYQPEYRFEQPVRIPYLDGSLAEIVLIGGMDILVRRTKDPLHFYAYDLKITANPSYLPKTLGQGVFYDMAVLAEFGVPLQQFGFLAPALPPPNKQAIPLDITVEKRRDMMARIINVAHARWREDFAPKEESSGCAWCGVKHACIKFKPQATSFAPVRGGRTGLAGRR